MDHYIDPMNLPPSTIIRRFVMALIFLGGALFHLAALVKPTISVPEPAHQHFLFIVLNVAMMAMLNTERALRRAGLDPRLEPLRPILISQSFVLKILGVGMFGHDLAFHGPLLIASLDSGLFTRVSAIDFQSLFALLWGALVVCILATEKHDV